jgi:predicted phage tail protein
MRKVKLFGVMALLGGVLSMLTPQASANIFKKSHHHHNHGHHQKAHTK